MHTWPRLVLPSLTAGLWSALVVVAVAALTASSSFAQDAEDPPMMGGDGALPMSSDRGVQPDAVYFRDQVLPLLNQHCMGCHEAGDSSNETKHRLVPPEGRVFTDEAVQRNYEGLMPLLHAKRPERSRLLAKLLPNSEGGIEHDGGKADDDFFPRALVDPKGPLVQWVFGATATNAAPIAIVGPVPALVTVGDEVRIDASLSHDPAAGNSGGASNGGGRMMGDDGGGVTVKWELVETPLGATARIESTGTAKARIVPDRDGPWTLRVHVSDGKLAGMPVLVRFGVARKTNDVLGTAPVPAGGKYVATPERRLIRSLYLDLYGRTPTDEELVRASTIPHAERVAAMLADVQMWETWFDEESFYFLLIDRFRPVSDRLSAVPKNMAERRITFRDTHTEFALSAEFNSRNPGNDTYVTVVLEQFLGVEVQNEPRLLDAAKKMYDGERSKIFKERGESQSDVVRISLQQKEYVDLFLRRMEQRYLGGPLPDAEHVPLRDELLLAPGNFPDLLQEWLVSERYTSPTRRPKTKSDHQFIRSLYVDLLGRAPAYEEFRNMRNALQALADPAPLRGVLAKVMLDSGAVLPPDAGARAAGDTTSPIAAQVQTLFRRLLGRDPGPDELAAFVSVLGEPGATWRTAALALLNSAHYQYY